MKTWDSVGEEQIKIYIRIHNDLPEDWKINKEENGDYHWTKPTDTWFSQYDMSKIKIIDIQLKNIYETANIFRFMKYHGYKPIIKEVKK